MDRLLHPGKLGSQTQEDREGGGVVLTLSRAEGGVGGGWDKGTPPGLEWRVSLGTHDSLNIYCIYPWSWYLLSRYGVGWVNRVPPFYISSIHSPNFNYYDWCWCLISTRLFPLFPSVLSSLCSFLSLFLHLLSTLSLLLFTRSVVSLLYSFLTFSLSLPLYSFLSSSFTISFPPSILSLVLFSFLSSTETSSVLSGAPGPGSTSWGIIPPTDGAIGVPVRRVHWGDVLVPET